MPVIHTCVLHVTEDNAADTEDAAVSQQEASAEDVRRALAQLLAWPDIARSSQLAGFLDYIVSRTLAGEASAIKAYSIAVDVFGRPADFDPQSDPIVRVQARRLRSLLDAYYAGEGAGDPVRILLPTGRYVPEFVSVRPTIAPTSPMASGAPSDRSAVILSWASLLSIAAVLIVLAFGSSRWSPPGGAIAALGGMHAPVIAVLETRLLDVGADSDDMAGLAVELVTDLEQFETVNPVYGTGPSETGEVPDYVLDGAVRRNAEGLYYSAVLTATKTEQAIWNTDVEVEAGSAELVDFVAGTLSRTLGSPRGPLHRQARQLLAARSSLAGMETLYLCRMLFDLYREAGSIAAGERAQNCYAGLPEGSRGQGQALAAVASLVADGIPGEVSQTPRAERLALAQRMLEEAVEMMPISGFVWEQQARYLEDIGDHAGSEAAYGSALQLNPANTDAMAARARHLALMGNLGAAEPLAALAINGAPDAPAWYFAVPALAALEDGEFGVAAERAQAYAGVDPELGSVLAIMAGQGLGDTALVARYVPQVLEQRSFREAGVLSRLRQRIADDGLVDTMRVALEAAGLPASALDAAF